MHTTHVSTTQPKTLDGLKMYSTRSKILLVIKFSYQCIVTLTTHFVQESSWECNIHMI